MRSEGGVVGRSDVVTAAAMLMERLVILRSETGGGEVGGEVHEGRRRDGVEPGRVVDGAVRKTDAARGGRRRRGTHEGGELRGGRGFGHGEVDRDRKSVV